MLHDVFVSYRREDRAHAAELAAALERSGFSVCWDRPQVGEADLRERSQIEFDTAHCVIVICSSNNASPAGDLALDEAIQVATSGRLVQVMMQQTNAPPDFDELPCFDLVGWSGSVRNSHFRDLVKAVEAVIDSAGIPAPESLTKRPSRRLFAGVTSATLIGGMAAFGANILSIQENACSITLAQPGLSDMCGAWGLGGKPTKKERLTWAVLPPGDCEALREHIRAFPAGVYRDDAADLITGANIGEEEVWTPTVRPLTLYVPANAEISSDVDAAKAAAVTETRAGFETDRVCRGFAAAQSYKYLSATHEVDRWNCSPLSHGVVCGFDGKALCAVEERSIRRTETC